MAQDDEFSKLARAEYDGVTFPLRSVRIMSGSAAAFHKRPHVPGQKIEYTGREPVSGVMVAPMFATLPYAGGGRNVFWPTGATLLREKAQQQKPSKLVIPVYGTLERAYIRIEEDYDAHVRDGCFLTINFAEDRGDLIEKGTVASPSSKIPDLASTLDLDLAVLNLRIQQKIDSLDGEPLTDFSSACSALLAMRDQSETSIRNRVAFASRIISSIDDLLNAAGSTLSDPIGCEAREAALDLKLAVRDMGSSTSEAARAIKAFVPQFDTDIVSVASANQNTVDEVISLNPLNDYTQIDAGEILLVYAR